MCNNVGTIAAKTQGFDAENLDPIKLVLRLNVIIIQGRQLEPLPAVASY